MSSIELRFIWFHDEVCGRTFMEQPLRLGLVIMSEKTYRREEAGFCSGATATVWIPSIAAIDAQIEVHIRHLIRRFVCFVTWQVVGEAGGGNLFKQNKQSCRQQNTPNSSSTIKSNVFFHLSIILYCSGWFLSAGARLSTCIFSRVVPFYSQGQVIVSVR